MSNKELLSVCFTGTCPNHTRAELVEMVAGKYEVKDSVTKGLDILVCADPNAGSSKLQKAEKNGVKIMSYEDFLGMLANGAGDKENAEPIKPTEQDDKDDIRKQADAYYDKDEYQKALELYLKIAEQNDADVLNRIGFCYYQLDDYANAVKWWQKAAEQGDVCAQDNLAQCYEDGEWVEKNYELAIEWYTKAAEQGHDNAQCNLGYCYYCGNGVERDYKKAVEWYTKSAEQGNALAINRLGVCYMKGNGVNKDPEKAVEWYTKAAEQGNMYAQGNLAGCYREGDGVEQDYEKAAEWYTKAAEHGHEDAKKALDDMYAQGLVASKNVPKMNDAEFGELTYYGKKGWRGKIATKILSKGELTIALEGSAKDKITDAQRKAYAEYKEKEGEYFKAMNAKAKKIYKDVDTIIPKTLFIDRQGNYGWMGSKTVILSASEVQFAALESILYNYTDVVASRTKKEWHTGDSVYLNLLGELDSFCVERGSYEFENDKDEEIRNGKLTEREVELLLWLQTEYDTSRIADEVLEYCNDCYDGTCYYDEEKKDYVDCEPIEKTDLFNEVEFSAVCLMTQDHARNSSLPDMAIMGECECDEDHGIAICFSDKGFAGIDSQANVL